MSCRLYYISEYEYSMYDRGLEVYAYEPNPTILIGNSIQVALYQDEILHDCGNGKYLIKKLYK